LLAARDANVTAAVLFTKNEAAARAYRSLGFQSRDAYHVTLFKNAFKPEVA